MMSVTEAIEYAFHQRVEDIRVQSDSLSVRIYFRNGDMYVMERYELDRLLERFRGRRLDPGESMGSSDYWYKQQKAIQRQREMMRVRYMGYDVGVGPDSQVVQEFYSRSMASQYPPQERCKSCDEYAGHKLDHHGWCKKIADKFWAKVRKLYWHRYSKGMALP